MGKAGFKYRILWILIQKQNKKLSKVSEILLTAQKNDLLFIILFFTVHLLPLMYCFLTAHSIIPTAQIIISQF